MRTNYSYTSYDDGNKNRGGDFDFDIFRLNFSGDVGDVQLNAEIRFFDYSRLNMPMQPTTLPKTGKCRQVLPKFLLVTGHIIHTTTSLAQPIMWVWKMIRFGVLFKRKLPITGRLILAFSK